MRSSDSHFVSRRTVVALPRATMSPAIRRRVFDCVVTLRRATKKYTVAQKYRRGQWPPRWSLRGSQIFHKVV